LNCLLKFNSFIWFITANDSTQSSSRGEEQCKEIEQEHHPAWLKPYRSSGCFCPNLFLCGLPLGQDVQKMRIRSPAVRGPLHGTGAGDTPPAADLLERVQKILPPAASKKFN
jgi:hypothetical protein